MKKRRAKSFQSWVMAFAFMTSIGGSFPCAGQASSPPAQPVVVSMIQLLSHPEKYEGKWILTRGFLSMQPEREYHLYLHEEDYKYALMNGMVLLLTENQHKRFERLNLKYVLIEGIVHSHVDSHNEGYSGEIADITRIEPWGTWVREPVSRRAPRKRLSSPD